MTTKKIVKQSTEPVNLAVFQSTPQKAFELFLTMVSATLSDRAITPAKLTETYELLHDYEKKFEKVMKYAKESLKAIVLEQGTKKETGVSKELVIGNYHVEIRPTSTKLDPKKVEALIRAKNISIEAAMDKDISYKINESKLQDLVARKKMTADELESCRADLNYSLQPPKRINE